MLRTENYAAALIVHDEQEWYVVGRTSDIQRLSDAGFVDRAWELKLDNGHRPYAVAKKRINFEIADQPTDTPKNSFTGRITAATGVRLAHSLHSFDQTYLLRETPAFWSDVLVYFNDAGGELNKVFNNFYAVYQGKILHNIQSVKFTRII